MAEPPLLPNSNDPSGDNPYAPTYVGTVDPSAATIHLDAAYWIGVACLVVGWVILTTIGLGWPAAIASIGAAIRVPILQHRHRSGISESSGTQRVLLPPLILLFTSLALNIVFIVVSFIAFAAICVPSAITFGMGDVNNTVVVVSGMIGLLCFCSMFYLSLRLRF